MRGSTIDDLTLHYTAKKWQTMYEIQICLAYLHLNHLIPPSTSIYFPGHIIV